MEWECLIEQSLARGVGEVSWGVFVFKFLISFFQGGDCVDDSEEAILKAIPEKGESEHIVTNVKQSSEPEEFLNNTRCPPITSCHMSKSSHSEITRRGISSQICDSDCTSSDSGFSDLSSDYNTCWARNIPPRCTSPTQKVKIKNPTNLQKDITEKHKKKHLGTLKRTNIGFGRQI